MGIPMGAAQKNFVLNADGMKLAGSDADKRRLEGRIRCLLELNTAALALGLPQLQFRREEKFFPRGGADDLTEKGVVAALFQPVLAGFLLVSPSNGQIAAPFNHVIGNRAV